MLTFFDDFGRWCGPTFSINPETGECRLVSAENGPPGLGMVKAGGIEPSLDVKGAAEILGCSPGLVRKMAQTGELRHHRLGKNLRFREDDIAEFWASHTASGCDKRSKDPKKGGEKRVTETKSQKHRGSLPIPTREEIRNLWQ